MKQKEFIQYILKRNGFQGQAMICMEELAELSKELSKYVRGEGDRNHIAEEVADVYLTVRQMQEVFGIDDLEIETIIQKKVDRYWNKQGGEQNG